MLTTEYTDIHLVTDATQAGAGVAGILNGAKLILGTNTITPTKTTAVGDITQPTYTGYAPLTITWGSAVRDSSGDIVTLSQECPIQMGDSVLPTTIKCWGLTDSGGTNLLMSEELASPLPLVDALTYFGLIVPFAPGNPQGKAAIIVS